MEITKAQVLAMDYAALVAVIKEPEVQALLRDRQVAVHAAKLVQDHKAQLEAREAVVDATAATIPPSTEQLAAEAAAIAAPVEEPVVAPPPPPVVEERKRIVREYQVRDEDGSPIGRPTHLEAWSVDELLEKMQTAHEQATRAFHRLKKQKITFNAAEAKRVLTTEEIKAAAVKALETKDAAEAEVVVKGILETSFKQKEEEIRRQRDIQEGISIGNAFLRRHLHDYMPVEANNKALGDYLQEHSMDYTVDNLELAFLDLMSENKLVKVRQNLPTQTATTETITPSVAPETNAAPAVLPPAPAAAPVETVAQPQAPVSQPTVAATAPTPAAPNQQPAARRPGVNGSLPPGTFSAERPEAIDPAQARREFMKQIRDMDPKVMKTKLANDPQFVKQLQSYGIRIK